MVLGIKLTSLKKSPVHFAAIRVTIRGNANDISPVVSIIITVKLIVIRTTPPNCAAAPTNAYFPGNTNFCNKKTRNPFIDSIQKKIDDFFLISPSDKTFVLTSGKM